MKKNSVQKQMIKIILVISFILLSFFAVRMEMIRQRNYYKHLQELEYEKVIYLKNIVDLEVKKLENY